MGALEGDPLVDEVEGALVVAPEVDGRGPRRVRVGVVEEGAARRVLLKLWSKPARKADGGLYVDIVCEHQRGDPSWLGGAMTPSSREQRLGPPWLQEALKRS